MKTIVIVLILITTNALLAAQPTARTESARIVTVENWGWSDATVWAVLEDRVLVYKVFDIKKPDELLAEIPIQKDQANRVRKVVASIPGESRGKVYCTASFSDANLLRISFTPDGELAEDRIEVQDLWLDWLSGIIEELSNIVPGTLRPKFKDIIDERSREVSQLDRGPVRSILIGKYYGGLAEPDEKLPNRVMNHPLTNPDPEPAAHVAPVAPSGD